MPKKIELTPKAEVGRGYVLIGEDEIEVRISGVMGALKVWLIGAENQPLGNIVGGRLIRKVETAPYHALLITQSGKQMFYCQWRDSEEPPIIAAPTSPEETALVEETLPKPEQSEYSPLPDLGWERITARAYPSADERVRFALSTRAFFDAFKKHGYYLFGRDGESFALAVRHDAEEPSPFPNLPETAYAGDYVYVVLN